jgi:hypothetical protein
MSSTQVELLACVECEEKLHFPADICLYRLPEVSTPPPYERWVWLPVLTDKVWCMSCNGPRYAERIPTLKEFNTAAAVRRFPDAPRSEYVEDELLEVENDQFQFLFTHLIQRRGPGNCLACGDKSCVLLQWAVDRIVNFKHPHCGGDFRFERLFVNAISRRTFRWFDVNGQFLGEQHGVS